MNNQPQLKILVVLGKSAKQILFQQANANCIIVPVSVGKTRMY